MAPLTYPLIDLNTFMISFSFGSVSLAKVMFICFVACATQLCLCLIHVYILNVFNMSIS